MLSTCANVKKSWSSTCLSETICRSLVCFRSSSACFRTRQHVRHTLSARDGATASPVPTAELRRTLSLLHSPRCSLLPGVSPRNSPHGRHGHATHAHAALGLVLGGLMVASHTPECRPPVPAATRASPTKRPFRFSTSCAPAWCARTRSDRGQARGTRRGRRNLCRWAYPRQGERRTRHGSRGRRGRSLPAQAAREP